MFDEFTREQARAGGSAPGHSGPGAGLWSALLTGAHKAAGGRSGSEAWCSSWGSFTPLLTSHSPWQPESRVYQKSLITKSLPHEPTPFCCRSGGTGKWNAVALVMPGGPVCRTTSVFVGHDTEACGWQMLLDRKRWHLRRPCTMRPGVSLPPGCVQVSSWPRGPCSAPQRRRLLLPPNGKLPASLRARGLQGFLFPG